MSRQRIFLGPLLMLLLAAFTAAAPDYSKYEGAKSQILEIRSRCGNTLVCVNKAVELSQTETESQKILEDVIKQKADFRHNSIDGVCFGVVIENKMEGFFSLESSEDKMRIAAYITYNLYEGMSLARPTQRVDCKNRIVIFYSRRDSTLYTFATEGMMTSKEIRTASAAARPYFSSSILEGMRFLILAYIDTIRGTK